jgi:hypothetical protein
MFATCVKTNKSSPSQFREIEGRAVNLGENALSAEIMDVIGRFTPAQLPLRSPRALSRSAITYQRQDLCLRSLSISDGRRKIMIQKKPFTTNFVLLFDP